MGIISWIIVGAIAGWLASIVMKTERQQGLIIDIIVGIVGAVLIVVPVGGVVRVDAATHRKVRNEGATPATIIVFGAQGGYVGRDGQEGEAGGFLDAG